MTKRFLVVGMFLSVVLIFTCNSWAQDEYECCCELKCCYNYNTFTDPFTLVETCGKTYSACVPYNFFLEELCEGGFQAQLTCIEIRMSIWEIIKHSYPDIWLIEYSRHTGSCELVEKISCSSESLLGDAHPQLDILREFRDEVLGGSEKGRGLIAAYYEHRDVLIEAFEKNPSMKAFATELLEKTIERLYTALGSGEELLTDEIAADIDILADELDMVVTSPELKKTMKQIKREIRKGTLFE